MSDTKIGGVVATLALKDEGFKSGLDKAAQSLEKTGKSASIGANDIKRLGGALAGTFGGGILAKIGPVAELAGSIGPQLLTAVPALGAVAAGAAAVGVVALPLYMNWRAEVDALNKELDDTLEAMDRQRNMAAIMARSDVDKSPVAVAAREATDALKISSAAVDAYGGALNAQFEEIDRNLAQGSELIAAKLANDIAKVRGSMKGANANNEIARLTAAADVAKSVLEGNASIQRSMAAGNVAAEGPAEAFDKANAAVQNLDTEIRKLQSTIGSSARDASGLSDIEIFKTKGGIPAAISAITAKISDLRKERADANNEDELATDDQVAKSQKALVQLEQLSRAQDARKAVAENLNKQQVLMDKARADAEQKQRDAVANGKVAALEAETAKLNAINQTKDAVASQTEAIKFQAERVGELGDSWKRVKGELISISQIAGAKGASSNRDLAQRAQRAREQAQEAEAAGRFSEANRRNAQADKLEGRLKRREILTPEEERNRALRPQAIAATAQVTGMMAEAERLMGIGDVAGANKLQLRASNVGESLRKQGFGSPALDKALDIGADGKRTADAVETIKTDIAALRELIGVL